MSSKTTNVEQYLLGRIRSGEFPVNARVPSQHRLMAKLNCSRITVQRAMKNLIRAGFLRSEKGRGTFVLPRRAEQHLSEVVIISKYRENSPNYPFTEMLFSLDTRGIPTRWVDYDFITQHEHAFSAGQMMLWLLPAENQIMTMHHLNNLGIPQLLINRTYDDFNCVTLDPWASLRDGLGWLLADGPAEIALISRIPDYRRPYLNGRLTAFYEECIAAGAILRSDRIFKRSFADLTADFAELGRCFFAVPDPPRKIFVTENDLIPITLLCASQYGMTPGRDFQLLTFSQGVGIPVQPGMALMQHPMDEFRREIERFLFRPPDDDSPFHVQLKTTLHII